MKKFLMAVAVLACASTLALAGPNAGGKLEAHDANLLMSATNGSVSVCGQGLVPASCDVIDTEIDGANAADPSVFKVYAAFAPTSNPRLMGLTWGVYYDAGNLILSTWAMCGDFELNDANWPAPGSGSSVTYNTVQQGLLTPVYWFAAYSYYGNPTLFQLGPNPSQGGTFGDDTVPAILDPIAGYGAMGFDMPGVLDCPTETQIFGACCIGVECTLTTQADCAGTWLGEGTACQPVNPCQPTPTGACCVGTVCSVGTQADCEAQGGTYQGDDSTCGPPNPCEPVIPVEKGTWGNIKHIYR